MTIQELSKVIADNLERRKRGDGDDAETFTCFKDGFYEDHRDIWDAVIQAQDHGADLDFFYEVLEEVADMIVDADDDLTEDSLDDLIYEMEADVYTHDLTSWLNRSAYNVEWLTEAIANGAQDGFMALSMAQASAKQEIARGLVQAFREFITEEK